MNRFLILEFQYGSAVDYCLVRCKALRDHNEYVVTIMNGALVKLLFGNHILLEKEGCLQLETTANEQQDRLKESVATALSKLLGLPVQKKQV